MKNQLKRDYINNALNKYKSDSKKLWQNIRHFWPSGKAKRTNIKSINGKTNVSEIVNKLNDHFSKIGNNPGNERLIDDVLNTYPPDFTPPTFDIKEIDLETVTNIIDSLTSSSSCSYGGITSYLIKSIKHQISSILIYLFNLSIKQKVFPTLWEEAKITPLFKTGNPDDPTNY